MLDVLVPASPVSTPLPAIVQIYGGDYTEGNAALLVSRRCNGEWIKRESDLCLDPVPAGFVRFLGGRDIVQNGRPERRTARSKGRR